MKRKWGKAITEVQRFVPQDFIAVCSEYVLSLASSTLPQYDWYKYDWDGDGDIDSDEGTTIFGTRASLPSVVVSNVEEVTFSNKWYKKKSQSASTSGQYDNTYYHPYTPELPIYKYPANSTAHKYVFFTGTKQQS